MRRHTLGQTQREAHLVCERGERDERHGGEAGGTAQQGAQPRQQFLGIERLGEIIVGAGIETTHIPYRGSAPMMTDLIGGQVNLFTADFAVMLPQVKAGKIRGLAVTSMQRSKAIPELPTVNEALGLKDYELIAYFAMFAPAGTPADVIAKLNKALNAAANDKDIQEKFAAIGFETAPGTPEALAQRNKAETVKWAKAIRDAKIEAE